MINSVFTSAAFKKFIEGRMQFPRKIYDSQPSAEVIILVLPIGSVPFVHVAIDYSHSQQPVPRGLSTVQAL